MRRHWPALFAAFVMFGLVAWRPQKAMLLFALAAAALYLVPVYLKARRR